MHDLNIAEIYGHGAIVAICLSSTVSDIKNLLATQSHLKPSEGVSPGSQVTEVRNKKTRVSTRRRKPDDPTVISFEPISACDRQTDR